MKNIYVSRTLLPSRLDYLNKISNIWNTRLLTNNGELVQELERKVADYLGVKYVVCVSSGTAATLIALKILGIKDYVYTSPNSYVSVASAPAFLGIKPVFQDADEQVKGPAIVTHLYGKPNIVKARPVIYDASHAFAFKYQGKYLASYGDVTIISTHAVKIFQSVEGGLVITKNKKLYEKAKLIRNFGQTQRYKFEEVGVNFKLSEFHAAMGILSLEMVNKIKNRLNQIAKKYNKALGYKHYNMTFYPIWYKSEVDLLEAIEMFEKNNIYPRRYFYPPLNKVFGGKDCPIYEDRMSRVLCLPFYYELEDKNIEKIINIASQKDLVKR